MIKQTIKTMATVKIYFFSTALEKSFVILENLWVLNQWTSRNQEFGQWEEILVKIVPINVISPTSFQIYNLGNGNDDISSEEHWKFKNQQRLLFIHRTIGFTSIYLNYISWPSAFSVLQNYLWLLPEVLWQYNSNCWNRN